MRGACALGPLGNQRARRGLTCCSVAVKQANGRFTVRVEVLKLVRLNDCANRIGSSILRG